LRTGIRGRIGGSQPKAFLTHPAVLAGAGEHGPQVWPIPVPGGAAPDSALTVTWPCERFYLASLTGTAVSLGTKPPGATGRPPRPRTMKLLTFPNNRTPQSGRNWAPASSRLPGNPIRLPLRSTSGAETLTVPGKPNGAEGSMVVADCKK